MHRRGDLVRQALVINDGLRGRRWELTGAAWGFYESEARRWAGTLLTDLERQSLAVSRATEWLSEHWPRPLEAQGRRILTVKDGPVLVSWSARDTHLGAIVISPERLQRIWKEAVAEPGTQTALTDSSGTAVMGSLSTGPRAVRSPAVFAMPAALVLTSTVSDASQAAVLLRRRFLIAAFAMLLAAVGTGSYFTLRSMARESAAARLQSEFVASVSHELRTPLTSLRQLSEMLMQDRIPTDAERRQSYAVLFQASQRLHRLVESLLDLGRMEAAEFRYQFAPVDPRALAARVVEEFRVQAAPGRDLVLTQPDHLPSIQADSEALAVALWNLLDNAVKYSPESEAVRIETAEVDAKVSIAVRDGGCGIEQADHERIFDRFVRGASAIRSNIKGTGIGLSMARHIVRANGGEILLNSEPGLGSTFTILIPTETPE
jgi:signal transduction histidine kinase